MTYCALKILDWNNKILITIILSYRHGKDNLFLQLEFFSKIGRIKLDF